MHDAVLYRSDDELLDVVVPFLAEGAGAGEPTLVAMDAPHDALIRDTMGDLGGLSFVPRSDVYQSPAGAIRVGFERFGGLVDQGAARIRVVGEVPHADEHWAGWARYESAINRVLAELPLWALCPYDTRRAAPAVLEDVSRTHPRIVTGTGVWDNPRYEDPASFLAERQRGGSHLASEQTPDVVLFDPTITVVRRAAALTAHAAGLSETRTEDLTLALTELTTNAYRHGRVPVTVEIWAHPTTVLAAVSDCGAGPSDPLVGLVPVPPTADGGRGLWITCQVCNDLSLTSAPDRFVARLAIW